MRITVYTDGSGLATGGPGGVGYVVPGYGLEVAREGSLPLPSATNQQAEILAVAFALHDLDACEAVRVVSDSEYVVKGWNERLPQWRENGWRRRDGGPVANRRHWERLIAAASRHGVVTMEWTKGHASNPFNERADRLAVDARRRQA